MQQSQGRSKYYFPHWPVLLAPVIALIIVVICRLKFTDFFFIDDAQNASLPFYKEMGRIWLSGHLPLMTTHTMLGSNFLVEIVYSPFCPQTIISSLVFASTSSLSFQTGFFAWLNIMLLLLGGYWLGQVLSIRRNLSMLIGFTLATCPIVIFLFLASWWNHANGQVWFIFTLAAIFQLQKKYSVKNTVIFVFCLMGLFTTGIVQAYITLTLFIATTAILSAFKNKTITPLAVFGISFVIALMLSFIPLTAEYIFAGKNIARESSFNNADSFLTPSWQQLLMFFNPIYHGFMNWFGGFRYVPLPLGYISVIALPIFIFISLKDEKNLQSKLLTILIFIALLLTQTSSNFGPTRWPFRYMPFLSAAIVLYAVYLYEFGIIILNEKRITIFVAVVTLCLTTTLFSTEGTLASKGNISGVILLLILLTSIFYKFKQQTSEQANNKPILFLWITGMVAWLFIQFGTASLANRAWPYALLQETAPADTPVTPLNGYLLSFNDNLAAPKQSISGLSSGQFLIYNQKSINGYSPVGHVGFSKLLPYYSAHGLFDQDKSIHFLTSINEFKIPEFKMFGISQIIIPKAKSNPTQIQMLSASGMLIDESHTDYVLATDPNFTPPEGTLVFQQGIEHSIKLTNMTGQTRELFHVEPRTEPRTLVFSRISWPGYKLTLNGENIPVTSYKDALVSITLPPQAQGDLLLNYKPLSWKYTRWSILLGFVLLLILCLQLRYGKFNNETQPV